MKNGLNNSIIMASLLLSLASILSCFRTTGLSQKIAIGLATGTGSIATTALFLGGVYRNEYLHTTREFKLDYDRELTLKNRDITTLQSSSGALIKTKQELETTLKKANDNIEELLIQNSELNRLLLLSEKAYREKVDLEDSQLGDYLNNFKKYLINTLYDYLSASLQNLLTDIERKLTDDQFTVLHVALGKKRDRIISAVDDFSLQLKNMADLPIHEYEQLANGFLSATKQLADIRIGYRALLNRQTRYSLQEKEAVLEEILTSSVPIEDAREKVQSVTELTREMLVEYRDLQNQKLESLYQNSSETSDSLVELDTLAKKYINRIQELETKIIQLEKPLQFHGSCAIAQSGNSISHFYFKNYGYRLDALNWLETDTGYELVYATRNNPGLAATELYQGNSREQLAAFTNSLKGTLPEFSFNYQNCTLSLKVTLRHPTKKLNSAEEIDKIWVSASKFESYVRRWERVRITAGSTGGKSPTAKNLALAIMKSRNGIAEIKLYDPQHGSKKDFWAIPKAGTSHEDNVAGMKHLNELLDARTKNPSPNHPFTLFIFDELDSTIAKFKGKDCKFADLVTYSLKQASHQNLGCIYIGQSVDANEIPGMSWSDWANAVQLHIGANAAIYLDKAQALTTEDKSRLLKQYRELQEYCDHKNEELGLDILTDASAYRFALAVPLTGLPKFIQLPDFDSYDYEDVMSINTQNLVFSNTIEKQLEPVKSVEYKPDIACPHCNSQDTHKNGFNTKNQQYYSCKSCDCKPRKWLIKNLANSI